MAEEWIKMRMNLQRHPKVVRMASALRADRFRIIGGLHAVWSVFDEQSEDGLLEGYTPAAMDDAIGWPGFSAAMQSVGWLAHADGEGLEMPEFGEHNGQSAKRRADDTKRKRKSRAPQCPQTGGDLSEECPQEMRTESGLEREREDISSSLRSEDKRVTALTVADLAADGLTEQTAFEFLTHRKRLRAPLTPRAWSGIKAQASKAGWTPEQAVCKALERGWRSFESSWVLDGRALHGPTWQERQQEQLDALTGRNRRPAALPPQQEVIDV